MQLVHFVVDGGRKHGEVHEVERTDSIVDVVALEVGRQFAEEACIAPFVAEIGGLWRKVEQRGCDVHHVSLAFGFDLSFYVES